MADFLGNLVTKSMGKAEEIRPRLPSLFEPPAAQADRGPAAAGPAAVESPPVQLEAAAQAAPPAKPEQELSAPAARPRMPRAPARPSPRHVAQPAGDSADEPTLAAPRPAATAHQATTPAAETASSAPSPAQARQEIRPAPDLEWPPGESEYSELPIRRGPGPAMLGPTSEAAAGQPAEPARSMTLTLPSTHPVPPGTPGPPLRPAREAPCKEPTAPRRSSRLETGSDGVPAQAKARPVPDPAGAPAVVARPQVIPASTAGPTPVAEPAPTVQVTIGRIEVRAMPPLATQPKAQRSGPAVMTLDEYLRQRNDGGGR